MTPYHKDEWLTVYQGDCREVMRQMPAESVHCVVTSPPYWGLRDYGVDGALGLEATPEEFVANMVDVFREVRRVLRKDGTCWVNLGDAFEDKQLQGMPWRVAFALQADGWYLRSDIIWAKPNPMPESVTDRPTKSHEYLFLLTKSPRYYYDADAVREDGPTYTRKAGGYIGRDGNNASRFGGKGGFGDDDVTTVGRNLRTVWTIATAPYPGAHFATFPPKLVEPCIKAGAPEKVCGECGAGWRRVTEDTAEYAAFKDAQRARRGGMRSSTLQTFGLTRGSSNPSVSAGRETTGFIPSCAHDAETVPSVVLDCFAGSGTTGMVAQSLSRRAVLIDLNGDYLVQAMSRNQQAPLGLETA